MIYKAPFPYFGGKSTIAGKVWDAIGDVNHYIEPFFGSGAVLFARQNWRERVETVNDKDGFLCNVWRGIQFDPDEVAKWCDWPVNHIDIEARRQKLIKNERFLVDNLLADEKWFDAELAGYWIYGTSSWIGTGFTSQRQHISSTGVGVHENRQHIIDSGKGVNAQLPYISRAGQGVHAKRPHISNSGQGVHAQHKHVATIYDWFSLLSERLRKVRVVCGDWSRVCGGNWQDNWGTVGMFFDPPYGDTNRSDCYHVEDYNVSKEVSEWCVKRGENHNYRIVVCGYDTEHSILTEAGWKVERWKACGGYSNTNTKNRNRFREVIWYSPHCLKSGLFDQ